MVCIGFDYSYDGTTHSVMGHTWEEIEISDAFCNYVTGENCVRKVAACVEISWSPDSDTVSSGQSFTQTSNCGTTREVTGTKSCSTSTYPAEYPLSGGTVLNCGFTTFPPQSWFIAHGRCPEIGIPGATPTNPI